MNKLPVVLPYIHTHDDGMELRYMLRSLANVKNFNSQVFIVGNKENWFYNINHIPVKRIRHRPYLDQVYKMLAACLLPEMPAQFIAFMDDIYITEPTKIGVYHLGKIEYNFSSLHKRNKGITKDKLLSMALSTKDYEAHAPMVVNKVELQAALESIIDDTSRRNSLQWRSIYGNMFNIGGKLFEDKKTKTANLKDGTIISTNFYTDELDKLFPEPSIYEVSL